MGGVLRSTFERHPKPEKRNDHPPNAAPTRPQQTSGPTQPEISTFADTRVAGETGDVIA